MVYAYVSTHTVYTHTSSHTHTNTHTVTVTFTNAVSLDVSCIRLIAIYHRNDEILIPFLRLQYISDGKYAVVFVAGGCLCAFQFQFVSHSFRICVYSGYELMPPVPPPLLLLLSSSLLLLLLLASAVCIVNTFAFTTVVDIFRLYIFPLLHLITIFAPLDG